MSVQFLSTEWAEALKAHLNGNDAFKQAAQGQNATIQQVITGGEGETMYWIRIADAAIDMGVGQAESPDATITQSYETAVEDIISTHPTGDVIVVAHGGVINAYFAHILKIADQDMFFLPENTSLNTVVIRGDERLAWFLSDASHLTDPGWFAPRLDADGDAVEAGA